MYILPKCSGLIGCISWKIRESGNYLAWEVHTRAKAI